MKALHITLLILIVIGLGLLVTRAYWVPTVVGEIMKHDSMPFVAQVSTTTQPITATPTPIPKPKPPAPTSTPPSATSGIDITATIGPTCPVAHYPESPECADKPYETTLVLASTIIGRNGGVLIKTDAKGHYSQNLGPGTYTIRAQSTNTPPTLSPVSFEVKQNARTVLTLQFDSGIR